MTNDKPSTPPAGRAGSLDDIGVATPCSASWDAMAGDERVRFCGQCQLNVFNLSGMARPEAESLVQNAEGRVCVRFLRRTDGTVLTRDCPVGLRQRLVAARARVAARVAALLAVLFAPFGCKRHEPEMGMMPPPPTPAAANPHIEMGEVEAVMGDAIERPPAVMGKIQAEPPPIER